MRVAEKLVWKGLEPDTGEMVRGQAAGIIYTAVRVYHALTYLLHGAEALLRS
jgi:hypothetical protein